MTTRGGNPAPTQEPLLRAQLTRRDAQIDRQGEQLRAYVRLYAEAKIQHERVCDCIGEACAVGAALVEVERVLQVQENQRRRLQGKAIPDV